MNLKKATSQAPSLLVLMSAVTGREKYRFATHDETKSLSCQSNKTTGPSESSMRSTLHLKRKVASHRRKNSAIGTTQTQ
jgi:hypothetical protein